jgi:hypothetical protein
MTELSSLAKRLLARDETLWPPGNVAPTRLGWLEVPRRLVAEAEDLLRWSSTVEQSQVVLLGMGGSSLGPLVLESSLAAHDPSRKRRKLVVCDTTDPETIASVDFTDSFVLVSSKSGTTLEVHTLLAHALELLPDPSRYVAITDPGTPLEALAEEKGFRRTFLNPPDIGGRYSVLSYFGMVPAALIGYDVEELCSLALDTDVEEAVAMGHDMGKAARAGRDKLTIVVPDSFRSFGIWVEQIVAESTGKQGTGCIPVPTTDHETGADRHQVSVDPRIPSRLGVEFYRWELATPIAGHVLGIDPFDEPNVAESKHNTNEVLEHLPLPLVPTCGPSDLEGWLDDQLTDGDYVSIQAYLPFGQDDRLESLRRRVRDSHGGRAVTWGYGPRFLHSTGQLHKGGPNSVVAVQLVPAWEERRLPIPGYAYDFATLKAAQSIGDYRSLVSHGRRVLRVAVSGIDEKGALR